jgi:RNA polymerase-binding transcription factor DksA
MTRADQDHFRSTLLALRARLNGDVSHLADEALRSAPGGAGAGSHAPQHLAEHGTDAFEQEFTLSLLHNQEQTLEEIDEALERLKRGTFGRCEECGLPIPRPRLRALPYTRHCVACAHKLQ